MKNIINVLMHEHSAMNHIMAQLETKWGNERPLLFEQLAADLRAHSAAEAAVLYPILEEKSLLKEMAFTAETEHRTIDSLLTRLEAISYTANEWGSLFLELQRTVMYHTHFEESHIFKNMETVFTDAELRSLADDYLAAKRDGSLGEAPVAKRQQQSHIPYAL